VFPVASNRKGIADKQKKLMKQIIFLESATKFILPPLQETGRASKDPNLPIDDRRKIMLPYEQ